MICREKQILELTYCLNLTMVQVREYAAILYELDIRLLIIKQILISTMATVRHVYYMILVI